MSKQEIEYIYYDNGAEPDELGTAVVYSIGIDENGFYYAQIGNKRYVQNALKKNELIEIYCDGEDWVIVKKKKLTSFIKRS